MNPALPRQVDVRLAGLEDGAYATHAIAKVRMHALLFGPYAPANTAATRTAIRVW